jgi:hypothetical protein
MGVEAMRGGAVDQYPRLQKVHRMLVVLNQALTQAEQEGSPGITVMIVRHDGPEVGVYLQVWIESELTERRISLAEELHLSGGETVSLFRWAEAAGYIRPNYGSSGPNVDIPTPHLEYLEPEGYELIGELPDPVKRLMLSLEAAEATIEARQDLRPEQKEAARKALEELKHFLRGLPPGVAVEVGAAFFRGVFGG